jgi:hypothetical protein
MKRTTTETTTTADTTPTPTTTAPSPQESQFRAIRRAGVSLCAIECADPAATMQSNIKALNGKGAEIAILQWDLINGMQGLNGPGKAYATEAAPDGPIQTGNPAECLKILATSAPAKCLVFMLGAARIIQDGQGFNPSVIQALWNIRDPFKSRGSTLALLSPGFTLPPELARDIVTISEPLPDAAQLGAITDSICADAGIAPPIDAERAAVLDTLTGLGAFEAEQTLALSISKAGIDRGGLWERKVKAIEATPGLTVYRGKEKLADVAGLANAKALLSDTLKGALRCSCIVFADEIDKGLAASGTDSSGTTQDQLKALLSYIQDNDIIGATALGPPGTGKTLLAKALANEFGIPLVMMDLGAMKGSLVGQSEQNMRQALKVIHAISGGRALFLGACNRDQGLPPELRRRFSYLLLYFDLPAREEKDAAWTVHANRLRFQGATVSLRPDQTDRSALNDDGWTGAEIRNACLKAYAMNTTLAEAAQSIVPISRSASEMVLASRKGASGRYISASRPGIYTYTENQTPAIATGRQMETA